MGDMRLLADIMDQQAKMSRERLENKQRTGTPVEPFTQAQHKPGKSGSQPRISVEVSILLPQL
jgi:hypothetical protein